MKKSSRPEGRVLNVEAENKRLRVIAKTTHPVLLVEPPVWDKKQCEKIAKYRDKDVYGNKHPYTGKLVDSSAPYPRFGALFFNGGKIVDNKWYKGACRLWPIIPDTFEIVYVLSWGYYIRKKEKS